MNCHDVECVVIVERSESALSSAELLTETLELLIKKSLHGGNIRQLCFEADDFGSNFVSDVILHLVEHCSGLSEVFDESLVHYLSTSNHIMHFVQEWI